MKVLLTNDDGVRSPLLRTALTALRSVDADVTIVAPAEEQSWKGKAVSRNQFLGVEPIDIDGTTGWAIASASPADCVHLALDQLLDHTPDLVVSGINVGSNVGIERILSSGTIGACFEGNIAGVPGLALSLDTAPEDKDALMNGESLVDGGAMDSNAKRAVGGVIERIGLFADLGAVTWNLNMPIVVGDATLAITTPGLGRYQGLFAATDGGFGHSQPRFTDDDRPGSDVEALAQGRVSLSMLDVRVLGALSPLERARLQKSIDGAL